MRSKKFDPKVFQLGYVALATPDIERTKDHYLAKSRHDRGRARRRRFGLSVDRLQPSRSRSAPGRRRRRCSMWAFS